MCCIGSLKKTLNAENAARKTCRAYKKSRRTLSNLRDILFTQFFVFM